MTGQYKKPLRLGEILVQQGVCTPDQIEIALLEQKKSREKLGKILVRLGFATEAIIHLDLNSADAGTLHRGPALDARRPG